MSDSFHEVSYRLHKKKYDAESYTESPIHRSWFDDSTVDYWRHHRMISPLTPLLKYFSNSSWLTIGDGRYGLDSIKLKKIEPALNVFPTDISTRLLQMAKEKQLISDFGEENAESLSFADDSFDFAFCKESFHHFPRPYLAVYEMLRVARKAVILIEPKDKFPKKIPQQVIELAKRGLKKMIRKRVYHADSWNFEESGNYVYTVSKREIEKIALGLQLPAVGFYYFNDYYEKGVEFEKYDSQSALAKRVRRKIKLADIKCEMGAMTYSGIIAIIFKSLPPADLLIRLNKAGFENVKLPANPYLVKP